MNPETLLAQIMSRIQLEQKTRQLKKRLVLFLLMVIGSTAGLAPSFRWLWSELVNSGINHYFSLLFSDFGAVISFWQEFLLSILEALPVMALSIFLSMVLVFLLSLKFLTHDLRYGLKNL